MQKRMAKTVWLKSTITQDYVIAFFFFFKVCDKQVYLIADSPPTGWTAPHFVSTAP